MYEYYPYSAYPSPHDLSARTFTPNTKDSPQSYRIPTPMHLEQDPPVPRLMELESISARDIEAAWTLINMREGVRRGGRGRQEGELVEEPARKGRGTEEGGVVTEEAERVVMGMDEREEMMKEAPRTPETPKTLVRTVSRKRSRLPEDETPPNNTPTRKFRPVKIKVESPTDDSTPSKKARRGILQCAPGAVAWNPMIVEEDPKVRKGPQPPPKIQTCPRQILKGQKKERVKEKRKMAREERRRTEEQRKEEKRRRWRQEKLRTEEMKRDYEITPRVSPSLHS